MYFILGFISGVVTTGLIFIILAFFRSDINDLTKLIEIRIDAIKRNAGYSPKGGIFMPENEAEITRQEVIAKNKREGKDTHISELM